MPKRKTQKEAIKAFRKAHGNRYGYEDVVYESSRKKVKIICPKHGPFWQSPYGHWAGKGCEKCGREEVGRQNRLSHEDFLDRVKKIWGDRYDLSRLKYINSNTKIEIGCKKHGFFMIKPHNFLAGRGCWPCGYKKASLSNKKFLKRVKKVHDGKYNYPNLKVDSSEDTIEIECPEHGIFKQVVRNHLEGSGCTECFLGRMRLKPRDFQRRAKKVHNNKYTYPVLDFNCGTDEIDIICPIHGKFKQQAKRHLTGAGCIECGYASSREKKRNKPTGGWSYRKWEKTAEVSPNFDSFKVYVFKLKESLFKLGKTFRVIKKRTVNIPYDLEVVYILEFDSAQKASDTESFLKRINNKNKIIPEKDFDGMHECYSCINPIEDFLKELDI